MTELALNILDIANNSTKVKAELITIAVVADTDKNLLSITISDNGCGMSEELLERVTDPFSTTRTTRKVGMGIPLFKMAAELAGGEFSIFSKVGSGTTTRATFQIDNIDREPMGDVAGTMSTLIGGAPLSEFILTYTVNAKTYSFDTREVKTALGVDELNESYVLSYIEEMIRENIIEVNGGLIL